ncbi:MAG: tRNA dimethylallyltransferase, partial [Candidatus Paceibacterota bacterium]
YPKKVFTVDEFRIQATNAIDDILARGKMPILCGGTGFYIQSIVDGITVPDVPANRKLREKLGKLSVEKLFTQLKKLDPARAKTVDAHNKIRLIRAIEIAKALGKVPKLKPNPKYECLQFGIHFSDEKTRERITLRLEKRIKAGMIQEAERLHKKGLSWKRMEELGLEYRYLALYLQKKISRQEMFDQLNIAIRQYAKRQMVWFKRDERILWVEVR